MIGTAEPLAAQTEATAAPVPDTPSPRRSPALLASPGAVADFLALTDDDTRARTMRALQRTSGNRAVTRMLARQPVHAPAPPQMEAAPKGEIFALDDVELAKGTPKKSISKRLDTAKLLDVPIPQLGVRVGLGAHAGFGLDFKMDYSATLEHVRIGLDDSQVEQLSELLWTNPGAVMRPDARDPFLVAKLSYLLGDFDGTATLVAPLNIELHAWAKGGFEVGATVAGAFEVASLGTGLEATLSSTWTHLFRPRLDLHCRHGRLDFELDMAFDADFALEAELASYVSASLLGFTWDKRWPLASADVEKHWATTGNLKAGADLPGRAVFSIAERAMELADLVRTLMAMAEPAAKEDVEPENKTAMQAGVGGPDLGAAGGSGSGPALPTGRYRSDPIPMIWYKPPGVYPMSIRLRDGVYWMTEPEWLSVPDEPGLADIRRSANTDGQGGYRVRIGVPVNSKFFPRIGKTWPRVKSGVVRTGTKQSQFRRLLSAQGFSWGSHEADHVRDLQWAGEDDYRNLWPLQRVHNNAANRILDQPISYRTKEGQDRIGVPLDSSDRDLWFRIDAIRMP